MNILSQLLISYLKKIYLQLNYAKNGCKIYDHIPRGKKAMWQQPCNEYRITKIVI